MTVEQQKIIQSDKVEIKNEGVRGMYATTALPKGTMILKIPSSKIMSVVSAKRCLPQSCNLENISSNSLLALHLIHEKFFTENSVYCDYLLTLPDTFDDPTWWTQEEVEWLNGSVAYKGAMKRIDDLNRMYVELSGIDQNISFEQCRWAKSVISSRAFPGYVVGGRKPKITWKNIDLTIDEEENDDELDPVLVPLADMLNHNPTTRISWKRTTDNNQSTTLFEIHLATNVKQGEQIFNNYGCKSNTDLLLCYGFVLEDNVDDHICVDIKLGNDDCWGIRKEIFSKFGLGEDVVISYDEDFNKIVVQMLFATANWMELQRFSLGELKPTMRNQMNAIYEMENMIKRFQVVHNEYNKSKKGEMVRILKQGQEKLLKCFNQKVDTRKSMIFNKNDLLIGDNDLPFETSEQKLVATLFSMFERGDTRYYGVADTSCLDIDSELNTIVEYCGNREKVENIVALVIERAFMVHLNDEIVYGILPTKYY